MKEPQVEAMVDILCVNMTSDKEQLRDISSMGLKAVIAELPLKTSGERFRCVIPETCPASAFCSGFLTCLWVRRFESDRRCVQEDHLPADRSFGETGGRVGAVRGPGHPVGHVGKVNGEEMRRFLKEKSEKIQGFVGFPAG